MLAQFPGSQAITLIKRAGLIHPDVQIHAAVPPARHVGQVGEDVTTNLRTVRNLPLELDTKKGGKAPELLEALRRLLRAE